MTNSRTFRQKTYEFLDGEGGSAINRSFNAFIILLIMANVVAIVLESHKPIGDAYAENFYIFELFSVLIFTIEYIARVWSIVEMPKYHGIPHWKARLKYLFTPLAIIDLLAIAPFYLSLFFVVDLRYLRMMRMLRLLKLAHYFKGFDIFLSVLSKEIVAIASAVLMVVILVIISASLMYTLERGAQPEAFNSIPHSIWWAVVTMTTVGYGDVTPVTLGGRLLASLIMLLGVGIVALPAGMLAARFGEELQIRKDRMRAQILHALEDGMVHDWEREELEQVAKELGLSLSALDHLIDLQKAQQNVVTKCPHCGKPIDKNRAN